MVLPGVGSWCQEHVGDGSCAEAVMALLEVMVCSGVPVMSVLCVCGGQGVQRSAANSWLCCKW